MSILPTTQSHRRMTVVSAAIALVGGGIVAGNFAGAASGLSALDYAQCDNGGPGAPATTHCPAGAWINGILNANNSHYSEDDVTPQRLTIQYPDKGQGDHFHTLTLRYLDRKAGIHAYDYLAAADTTMKDAINDRCNGIPASYCPAGTGSGGAPSQASVQPAYAADATTVLPDPGQGTGLAKDHMSNLSADNLKLSLFGATFTAGAQAVVTNASQTGASLPAISTPTHDNACLGCGDDYATIVLSFKTTGNGSHNVQLLFGGHLAAGENADGWGTNLGAGSVSGGPYHIKWAAADGVSVGNRDNQIMSNAIAKIQPQGSTLTTSPTPSSGDVGSTDLSSVIDTAELTPDSGHAPTGSMTFTLYGPLDATGGYNNCTDPDPNAQPPVAGNVVGTPETGVLTSGLKANTTNTYIFTSSGVDMTGLDPGVYQFVADYVHGGDQFNTDEDGTCGDPDERVTINQGSATGDSTQTVSDTVTVSSDVETTPTGTVDWYFYDDLTGCQSDTAGNLVDSDVVGVGDDSNNTLDGTASATSKGITPSPAAGGTTYYWKVVYSGDTDTAGGVVEDCTPQQVTIQNVAL